VAGVEVEKTSPALIVIALTEQMLARPKKRHAWRLNASHFSKVKTSYGADVGAPHNLPRPRPTLSLSSTVIFDSVQRLFDRKMHLPGSFRLNRRVSSTKSWLYVRQDPTRTWTGEP